MISTLVSALGDRQVLLLLDNCEHLLDACAVLVHALVSACPRLQVLATSRCRLTARLSGASRCCQPQPTAATEAVAVNPSVQLFVERATAVQSRFVLNERNAAAVAQICRRLDGGAMSMCNLGMAARWQQDYDRAAELFRSAISAARSLGAARGHALAGGLARLGRTTYLQGACGQALSILREALAEIEATRWPTASTGLPPPLVLAGEPSQRRGCSVPPRHSGAPPVEGATRQIALLTSRT
jgi:hypothetical protein